MRLKHIPEAPPEPSNAYEVDGLKGHEPGKISQGKGHKKPKDTASGFLIPEQGELEMQGEIIVDSKGTPTDLQHTEGKMGTLKKPGEPWWQK